MKLPADQERLHRRADRLERKARAEIKAAQDAAHAAAAAIPFAEAMRVRAEAFRLASTTLASPEDLEGVSPRVARKIRGTARRIRAAARIFDRIARLALDLDFTAMSDLFDAHMARARDRLAELESKQGANAR